MELFRLFGSILIDDEKAIATLKDAEKHTQNSSKAMQELSNKASAMGKAIGVGVTAAVTALGTMVTKSTEATDRIDKMSQKLGLSAKGFQEWDYILGQNGISIDSLQGGIKTLTNMTDELKKGTKTATDSFDRLGISVDDIKGKSQEDIFNLTVEKLMQVQDETERAAIANDLLGRSGSELAPLLNQGSEAVDELRQRAHDLGLVLDDDAVTAGVELGDTIDDVKKSLETMATKIGVTVMPMVQQFFNWVLDYMPTIQEVMERVFTAISDSIQWVSENLNWLLPILGGVLAGFVAFEVISTISSLFAIFTGITAGASGAMAIFNAIMLANPIGMVAIAIGVLIAAIAVLWTNWDGLTHFFGDTFEWILGGVEGLVNGFIDGLNWLIEKANKIAHTNFDTFGKVNLTMSNDKLGDITNYQEADKSSKYKSIGEYADGGIAYGNTLAVVGEYAGVENNPEVIAPLNKLKQLIGSGQNITVNFYPQKMSDDELDNAFNYMNRRFGMEV